MSLERVARRARVSTATVSRVLNNTGPVKSSTRARVLKAIEAFKYSPNLHARSLAGGQSRSIGVIVSNIDNPFFLDVYRAVETRAHDAGYEVIMAHTDYTSERLVSSIRLMIGRRVAGLAAIVSEMDSALITELSAQRIPVVFYDVGTPRRNITNIRVDYASGMSKLTSYLYSLGHRRLGFLAHHATLGPVNERQKSVLAAARRHRGVQVATAADADTLEGGRRAARALLDAHPRVTAVVCVNDLMAVGAMRELRTQGPPRPRGRVGDGVRQHHARTVLPAGAHHGAHSQRHDRRNGLRLPDEPGQVAAAARVRDRPELVLRESTGPAPSSRK